jgi:hypothetical protein
MPTDREPMRNVQEFLRLRRAVSVSERQIAIGVSGLIVGEDLRRDVAIIGITRPINRRRQELERMHARRQGLPG